MKWYTPITIKEEKGLIHHCKPILLMGSCFSENVGMHLKSAKFDIDINPFGTLYNPLSLAGAIERLMQRRAYEAEELAHDGNLWYSYHHHGSFSHPDCQQALQAINTRYLYAAERLPQCSLLIITMGTAYVYEHKERGEVVANCHKQPATHFNRYRLTVEQIVERWDTLLQQLKSYTPACKVLFTVSPIRHMSDGAHNNQLSKSTLLLAIEALCSRHPEMCSYFPSYELVLDELRDYRFYNEDMTHPSAQAVQHIYQRLAQTYFTEETMMIAEKCSKISRSLQHRPLNGTENSSFQAFARKLITEMEEMEKQYQYISYAQERTQLQQLISQ